MATKPTTPQAAPQVTVDAAAPPVTVDPAATPAPADAAVPETPAEDPPIVNGIIRLRDASGALHDFSLDQFGEAEGASVRALLPPMWQAKIDAQQAFILNYRQTITDIPAELRAPGAFQKVFDLLSKQGGYISDETSPAVRAFLDGPYCAELRRSGLYKGYKTADALGTFVGTLGGIVLATPEKYFSALTLPVRGLIYAGGALDDKLSGLPAVSEGQALALASAYQGAMYMATESEFAPKETKTSAPGAAGTVGGYLMSGFNNVAVFAIAAWNMASGYISGKPVEWKQAWADAETYWTNGKGLKSATETAQEIATSASLETVRPAVETLLRGKTIAGIDPNPYLDVKPGDFVASQDGVIGTYQGPDSPTTPLPGPDGVTPLKIQSLEAKRLADLQGGLFSDRTTVGIGASALGIGGAALTGKGIAQGFARTTINGERSGVVNALKSANTTLGVAEKALDKFDDDVANGKTPRNWRGKPLDRSELKTAVDTAEGARNKLSAKLSSLSTDPVADAKGSTSRITRTLGNLAEAADHKLPADASLWEKAGHRLSAFGRPLGGGLAHVWNSVTGFVTGTVSGVDSAITPNTPAPSGAGAFAGRWATRGLNAAAPLLSLEQSVSAYNAGDTTGTVVRSGQTVAVVGTIAKIGFSRATPIVGGLVSGGEFVNAAAHGDGKGMRSAAVDLSLIGGGAATGFFLGSAGFALGPVGAVTAPAGAAIGATVGGIAVAGRSIYNMFWGEGSKPEPVAAAPATDRPQPRVAAVVDARQPSMSERETIAALVAQNQELMARLNTSAGQRTQQRPVAFNAGAFSGISTRGAAVGN